MTDERHYDELVATYVDNTLVCSFYHHARRMPGAQEVADKGEAIVPALLRALERGEGGMNMMFMLGEITGEWPSAPADEPGPAGWTKTNVHQAADLWLAWGRERELIA